jgi:polyhydroxyalkanoate synthesis regulator phasin
VQGLSQVTRLAAKNGLEPLTPQPKAEPAANDEFSKMLQSSLSGLGKERVSEEELFSAVIRERIATLKGEGEAEEYDKLMAAGLGSMSSYEDMAKAAVSQLVADEELSEEEAGLIYSQSFAAAQLDHRAEALFDDRGNTKATDTLDSAIARAKAFIDGLEGKEEPLPSRDRNEVPDTGASTIVRPAGNRVDGQGGFRYIAFSDQDGNVFVKAPSILTGLIDRIELRDANGTLLESAEPEETDGSSNVQARFKKSGSEYPSPLKVDFVLKSEGVETYIIPDSSLEWD